MPEYWDPLIERMPVDEMKTVQEDKLKNLVRYVYDIFGTSEISGPLFTECTYQDGIHIWADQFLIEVIDTKTGEPLPDGERGEWS